MVFKSTLTWQREERMAAEAKAAEEAKKKSESKKKPTGQLKMNMKKMPPQVQKRLMDAMKRKRQGMR